MLIPSEVRNQVEILKQITRDYILSAPSLAAQQKGQRRILTERFDDLYDAGAEKYLPKRFAYLFDGSVGTASKSRLVADAISSLTENEAVGLHARLRGHAIGSLFDSIVR